MLAVKQHTSIKNIACFGGNIEGILRCFPPQSTEREISGGLIHIDLNALHINIDYLFY